MQQQLLSGCSNFRVLVEALHCELNGFGAKGVKYSAEVWLFCYDGFVDLLCCFAEERRPTRQHYVSNDTHTPYVYLCIIRKLLHNLWSHIQRTSQHLLQLFSFLEERCKSEIRQFDLDIVT